MEETNYVGFGTNQKCVKLCNLFIFSYFNNFLDGQTGKIKIFYTILNLHVRTYLGIRSFTHWKKKSLNF